MGAFDIRISTEVTWKDANGPFRLGCFASLGDLSSLAVIATVEIPHLDTGSSIVDPDYLS